ncbi:MAG: hypothetical protein KKE20_05690 [Nanoarchaeota archaeon]|nr:hypothetical protein [Nanoarchaeota archaeon]
MSLIIVSLMFFWESFKLWLYNIFVTPFTNLQVLWILIPIYLGMILAELFQEKKGTSMGNAISNSVIVLWGGIDFMRVTINGMGSQAAQTSFWVRILISIIIITYGIGIIVAGIKSSNIIKYTGRIREVSYFIIIFAPLYYAGAVLSFRYLFGALLFFALFYAVIEVLDKFLPDPQAFVKDIEEAAGQPSSSNPFSGGSAS